MTIAWDLIERLEGSSLDGYVPDQPSSKSGVTIACGIDLGQQNWQTLLPLPDTVLSVMLRPYCGLRGEAAVDYLAAHPLRITKRQAEMLDGFVRAHSINSLRMAYNASGAVGQFDALPDEVQTVLASVHFQYGDLPSRCPRFWETAVAHDWKAMHAELLAFGDRYGTRRAQEAAFLSPLIEV